MGHLACEAHGESTPAQAGQLRRATGAGFYCSLLLSSFMFVGPQIDGGTTGGQDVTSAAALIVGFFASVSGTVGGGPT